MTKIREAFEKGKAFIPFITCGDPDLETTAAVVREAVRNGADLVELGIPFSDPTAEGPVIQGANIRALAGGMTTDRAFALVENLRQDVTIPLVFMTYANVVFSYGADAFFANCAKVGIDGIILPDLPFEEKDEFQSVSRKYGVDLISLIAPTSHQRIAMIAREAEGFLYIVSSLGVTGTRSEITTDHTGGAGKYRCTLRHRLRHIHSGAGKTDGGACRRGHCRISDHQAASAARHTGCPGSGRIRQRNEAGDHGSLTENSPSQDS